MALKTPDQEVVQPRETKSSSAAAAQQYDGDAACVTEPLDGEREAAAAEPSGPLLSRHPQHHLVNTITACAPVSTSAKTHADQRVYVQVCFS